MSTAADQHAPTPAVGPRRLLIIAAGALILIAPGVVVSLAWSAEAASPIILGSLVGAIATVALGWRLALVEVFILGMSIPVAVVAGAEPLAGAGLMALLCLFTGLSAAWGMNNAFRMVPLVLAYPMIHPPPLGALPTDRMDAAYLLALTGLMVGGALWMTVIISVFARHRSIPELQPAARADAIEYTILITVLVTVNTFLVLLLKPSSEGAWLILTLIAVTQLGPMVTVRRTVLRIVGTVIGTGVAAGIGIVVTSPAAQQLIAVVAITAAMYFRSSAYWLYVSFLTPAVVLLSSSGDVAETGEYRLAYTVIGATQVLLACALAVGYQRLREGGRAPASTLQAEPLAAPAPVD